jgi:phosphatidylserine/phosphatidylglycerophosphate/cardiolipin synthase-like enzyme
MLDVGVGLKTNMPTIKTLKAIAPDIDIVKIDNGIQNGAINHNKFTLFSDISTKGGKAKNVVFTSSDNLSPHQQELIQNAAILSDKGLYQAYLGYWQAMKKLADRKMKNYTFKKYSDPDAGIWAYFFPKRKNGNVFGPDPIIKVLDGITDPSSATIQIEMPFWTKYRMRTDVSLDGISIVGKLSKLMKQGAKVEAVVRSNVDNHDSLVALAHQGAFIKMYNYSDVPNVKQIGLHSKVMLIQGEWHGNKTKLAIVGSQNFGGRPLIASNNNTLVLSSYHFKHPQFFKLYEDNFNELKKLSGVCCAEKD